MSDNQVQNPVPVLHTHSDPKHITSPQAPASTSAPSPGSTLDSPNLPSKDTSSTNPIPVANKVSKPKKKSKKLCQFKNCTNPHSIIGDCSFCTKKFCTRHRLLEAHSCEHYREVKTDYHERNARQLESQQTVVSKV